MKVWMSFTGVVFLLLIIVFGFSLSSNIFGTYEKLIFWMLYLISIGTTAILIYGFYINRSLKKLKGPRGPRGEPGDSGEQGITGLCDPNCRNKICDMTILRAIGRKLAQLEKERNGESITGEEKKAIDYIFYFDSLNLTSEEIQEKMTEKMEENKLNNSEFINIEYIKKTLSEAETENNIEVTNLYIKEKVKSMCHSKQFKELSPVRGPQKLIEYLKDIWIDWTELIYNAGGGVEYFTTVGAENDFEWVKNNPFNEMKKYDVFYWGLPSSGRPRSVPVKPKYEKKTELPENVEYLKNKNKNEGFTDYENLEPSVVFTNDKPSNKEKLKLLSSNAYFFTYDDKGTEMYPNMRTYRPIHQIHDKEKYYPLGDIAVAPTNKLKDYGSTFKYVTDFNNQNYKISESPGRLVGPNVDTVLVAGDVKKPIDYKAIWDDTQDKQERHRTRNAKRFGRHRGIVFKPVCPKGYGSLGHVFSSRRRLTADLVENTDQNSKGRPKGDNQPVCIPENCIERLPNKPSEIWDTRDSRRGGQIHTYRKKWGYKRVYSFNKINGRDMSYRPATHENAYNLFLMRNQGKNREHKKRYMNRIKESCIVKRKTSGDLNNINNLTPEEIKERKTPFVISGDDYQFPDIMKEDKYGFSEEDKMVYFIDENSNSNSNSYNSYNDNYKIIPFINIMNAIFKKNKSFSKHQLSLIKKINKKINRDFDKFDKNIIVEYLGFLSSMPNTTRYNDIHQNKEDIYDMLMASIGDVNNEKTNNSKNKLGLGWEEIPRMDKSGRDYSIHDFFYIPNKGILTPEQNGNLKITFELVKNPNFYTLYLNDYEGVYFKQTDKDIQLVGKDDINLENNSFHFKIKLTGNKSKIKEVQIYDRNDNKVLNYELSQDGNRPKFVMKGNIIGGHNSKLFIIE